MFNFTLVEAVLSMHPDRNSSSRAKRQGEDLDFNQLQTNEQEFLHALVRTLGVPTHDAPDVLQAANVYLIQNAEKFILGTNFRAWAAKVTRFRCLSYFREQKRRPMVNLSEQVMDLITEEVTRQFDHTERQLKHLGRCLKLLPM